MGFVFTRESDGRHGNDFSLVASTNDVIGGMRVAEG